MSNKSIIWVGVSVGSIVGSWLPTLFGAGYFSGWSIILGGVGGLAGIWICYRLVS